jgi:hypothetical protein
MTTRRTYTADDIASLTFAATEAQALDVEIREIMAEVSAILEAHGATYPAWQEYHPELAPIVEAMDTDKHPFATANTSYIPQVGHLWLSRWNPTTWHQRNRRTRRDIDNLRKAIEACGVVA